MKKLWIKKSKMMMAVIAVFMMMVSVPEMGNIMTVEAEEIMDENDMQGNGSGDGEQETDNEESGSSVGEEKGGISGSDSGNGGIAPCAEERRGRNMG